MMELQQFVKLETIFKGSIGKLVCATDELNSGQVCLWNKAKILVLPNPGFLFQKNTKWKWMSLSEDYLSVYQWQWLNFLALYSFT